MIILPRTYATVPEVLEIYNLKDSTHVVCMGPHGEPEFQVSGDMVFLRVSWDLAMCR